MDLNLIYMTLDTRWKVTKDEHLTVVLIEELAELQKELSKVLRFGWDDVKPGKIKTNKDVVIDEMNDVLAMLSMLNLLQFSSSQKQAEKIEKVLRYLDYSNR